MLLSLTLGKDASSQEYEVSQERDYRIKDAREMHGHNTFRSSVEQHVAHA